MTFARLQRKRVRERHPIEHYPPGLSAEERCGLLECNLARLWDEVWWHQLPFYRRWYYTLVEGHRSPIRQFYLPHKEPR